MRPLSGHQRHALSLLAQRRCYTGRATYGMNIHGRVAQSLVRKGLARYVRGWPVNGDRGTMTVVEITDEGMAEFEGRR